MCLSSRVKEDANLSIIIKMSALLGDDELHNSSNLSGNTLISLHV